MDDLLWKWKVDSVRDIYNTINTDTRYKIQDTRYKIQDDNKMCWILCVLDLMCVLDLVKIGVLV